MDPKDSEANLTNLIVNYLPQDFRNGELYSMFITMGPIESYRVMINKKTGYSYGYGFVNYKNQEDAAKAIEKLNGYQIGNKKIKVAYALPCSRDELGYNNLYIRRLPRNITEEKLQELFGQFGTITQKKLLKDCVTGMNRGVGFVRFSKRSEAQAAIEALHDKIPPGGTERLSVRVSSDQKDLNMAFYAGFFESQKYAKVDCDPVWNVSPPHPNPLVSSPRKSLQQHVKSAATPTGTHCLAAPYLAHPNQNVAFRQRAPAVGGHQPSIFPPNQVNGNVPQRGDRTGFVRNLHHITPAPSPSEYSNWKNRWPNTMRPSRFPIKFNPINY